MPDYGFQEGNHERKAGQNLEDYAVTTVRTPAAVLLLTVD